jgi:PDZ domain-containing protein
MPRRALTLLLAGLTVIAAAVVAAVLPVPYVIFSPGPTLNTLGTGPGGQPLIDIKGHLVNKTSGHLNMVTIDFEGGPGDEINIFTALRAWLDPHNAVVPQAEVFGTGESAQQVLKQDVQEMAGSQQLATAAALTYLKIPFKTLIQVASTEPGMPAAKVLRAGDVIADINGNPIDSLATLSGQIRSHPVGAPLNLTVIRKGKTIPLVIRSVQSQGHAEIGVVVVDQYKFPFNVTISVGNIGGPSAGMMFALGIIDKVGSANLTGGRFIAGTGEISQNGAVSPIGGIQQKIAGARAQGATVFLSPAANCADALSALPAGMRLIKVSTLSGAVGALEALKAGRPTPSC